MTVPGERTSWITVPADSDFSLLNVPFGVFSPYSGAAPRCGVAIGDSVLDLSSIARLLSNVDGLDAYRVFSRPALNEFMSCPRSVWTATRNRIIDLLTVGGCDSLRSDAELCKSAFHDRKSVQMHLPAEIGDYTDFYSSREHATRVGSMLRDPANALNPNWLHLPVRPPLSDASRDSPLLWLRRDEDDGSVHLKGTLRRSAAPPRRRRWRTTAARRRWW